MSRDEPDTEVDGLFAIARAVDRVADVLERIAPPQGSCCEASRRLVFEGTPSLYGWACPIHGVTIARTT